MERKRLVVGAALVAGLALGVLALAWPGLAGGGPEIETAAPGEVVVYRSPACGCCGAWAEHLREGGFEVRERNRTDMAEVKAELGVPDDLYSCHTAVVDGYVLEGHVPASDLRRLLAERPDVAGLAVPGMPTGSPGMEGPDPDRYAVVAFDGAGGRTVFARH